MQYYSQTTFTNLLQLYNLLPFLDKVATKLFFNEKGNHTVAKKQGRAIK